MDTHHGRLCADGQTKITQQSGGEGRTDNLTDNKADKTDERDKVFDWMETIAQDRIPGIHHMTWVLEYLLRRRPNERETHYVISVELDRYVADTATMSSAIRKEMAARRGGETILPGLARGTS
jgi:hypothetical protein